MSLTVKPVFLSKLAVALAGAIAKSTGSTAASSYPIILANGLSPLAYATSSSINTKAAAPSLSFEALAAVIVPVYENAGFNDGNF